MSQVAPLHDFAPPSSSIQSRAAEGASNLLVPHKRILELDALRAIAAINLVLFHFAWVYAEKFGYTAELGFRWPFGAYGVEMFFILSGFVNSMSLLRRKKPVDFIAARMIRIVPVFLLVIIANFWILQMAPMNQSLSTSQFMANMTLLPRIFGYECVDPVMWTLQVEMMFYATLVIMFKVGALDRYFRGWGVLLALSVIVCPLLDSLDTLHGETGWFAMATAARRLMLLDFVPLFAIGFLLYMIKTDVGKRWQNILGIIVAAAVFHTIDHGKHNPVVTALIVGLITACAYDKVPVLRFQPLVYISTISYAIYLCHNNLGCAIIHRLDMAGVPPVICFAVALAFTFATAVIVTNRIEQPITYYLRKRWSEFRNRTASTSSSSQASEMREDSAHVAPLIGKPVC